MKVSQTRRAGRVVKKGRVRGSSPRAAAGRTASGTDPIPIPSHAAATSASRRSKFDPSTVRRVAVLVAAHMWWWWWPCPARTCAVIRMQQSALRDIAPLCMQWPLSEVCARMALLSLSRARGCAHPLQSGATHAHHACTLPPRTPTPATTRRSPPSCHRRQCRSQRRCRRPRGTPPHQRWCPCTAAIVCQGCAGASDPRTQHAVLARSGHHRGCHRHVHCHCHCHRHRATPPAWRPRPTTAPPARRRRATPAACYLTGARAAAPWAQPHATTRRWQWGWQRCKRRGRWW